MPTGRRPITESATRFESERAAPRVKLQYYPSPRLGRHPNWTWCLLSYCTDIRFLQLVVDYRLTPPSLDRWGIPPAAALIRWVCNDFERRHLRTTPELRAIPIGLELADRREVMMSMSEYEERFRSPTPSLHQIFAATGRPNRGRQWARRLWVAAALVGKWPSTWTSDISAISATSTSWPERAGNGWAAPQRSMTWAQPNR